MVSAAETPILAGRVQAGAADDSSVSLAKLLVRTDRGLALPVRFVAEGGPVYYTLTVDEIPTERPTEREERGIAVERWYERYADGRAVTTVEEGELVRVRLRVTVPTDREFVAVEDPLPAGLEAVDLTLHTSGTLAPFAAGAPRVGEPRSDVDGGGWWSHWSYGSWYGGWWSPWEHRELRDDRVVYFARRLWKGTYAVSYVARATTAGTFVQPPAHAEEMYNPALSGRSAGGTFKVSVHDRR